ncbi:class I SAM-dependent methyltransferase [Desulfococcus sp.]|uniref:class I SAM-dependent methyltransferase n=1 Tax=Desulfococcus sp. TaxID=2025834 RepID=UPI0035946BDF
MTEEKLAQKYQNQAEMLANRVSNRFKHLHRRYARRNIEAFRLYDWEIPEIRAAVDWYAGHLVVAEYIRRQSTPEWLPMMGAAAAAALDVPLEKVHLKRRFTGGGDGIRYERLDTTDEKIVVREGDLSFRVNLNDYVDTGLFSDHRNTRRMVKETAAGRDFLNLFCYTGTFSCHAARGGARRTVSVDRSETAILWARENMALNGIPEAGNTLIQSDTFDFLERAAREQASFDLAVVDPPSFSTRRDVRRGIEASFDVSADHPGLLNRVIRLMRKGGVVLFSTNHQQFEPRMNELAASGVEEITARTIPEDYASKRKAIHRCWRIVV